MRRTFAKAKLSFSGGPHASVNVARYAGSWTVSGSKGAMEGPSVVSFLFSFTDIHFFHTIRHVCSAREAKPRFGSALVHSAHDCETRLVAVGWSVTSLSFTIAVDSTRTHAHTSKQTNRQTNYIWSLHVKLCFKMVARKVPLCTAECGQRQTMETKCSKMTV